MATWQQVLAVDPHILQANVALLTEAIRTEDAAAIHSQIMAIHDAQFDDDRMYSALWEQAGRRPRYDLGIGTSDDLGLIRSVSPPYSEAGIAFRWTQGPALVRMPGGGATALHLQVHGWEAGQVATVKIDGQTVGSCALPLAWSTCDVRLPAHPSTRVVMLESPVDVPWPPGDYLPRGVALARVWLTP